MKNARINFIEKFSKFSEQWTPKVIAELNDYQFKLVRIQGEFTWHSHQDTDEVFIVLEGEMLMNIEQETVKLNAGEMFVVEKGSMHKPQADEECLVIIIEPRGVKNTGEKESDLTAANDVWI